MTVLTDTYTLANGVKIPKVGFGTWQTPDGDVAYDAVSNALKAGYRHIDTAKVYGNEESVGRAIKDSGLAREDLFITTKCPAETKTYEGALADFESSLKRLQLDYVDLYLIHAPWSWKTIGQSDDAGNKETWRAFESIYESGRAKAIGISNFDVDDMTKIFSTAKIKPMVNQIQYYVGFTEPTITKFSEENGLLVEAYSPLATGHMLENEQIVALAKKYGVTAAQIAIRFCLENGTLPLPKATSLGHIEDNAAVDFEISVEDMKVLNALSDTATDFHHNPTQG